MIKKNNKCFGGSILNKMPIFWKKALQSSKRLSNNSLKVAKSYNKTINRHKSNKNQNRRKWKIFQKIANKIEFCEVMRKKRENKEKMEGKEKREIWNSKLIRISSN